MASSSGASGDIREASASTAGAASRRRQEDDDDLRHLVTHYTFKRAAVVACRVAFLLVPALAYIGAKISNVLVVLHYASAGAPGGLIAGLVIPFIFSWFAIVGVSMADVYRFLPGVSLCLRTMLALVLSPLVPVAHWAIVGCFGESRSSLSPFKSRACHREAGRRQARAPRRLFAEAALSVFDVRVVFHDATRSTVHANALFLLDTLTCSTFQLVIQAIAYHAVVTDAHLSPSGALFNSDTAARIRNDLPLLRASLIFTFLVVSHFVIALASKSAPHLVQAACYSCFALSDLYSYAYLVLGLSTLPRLAPVSAAWQAVAILYAVVHFLLVVVLIFEAIHRNRRSSRTSVPPPALPSSRSASRDADLFADDADDTACGGKCDVFRDAWHVIAAPFWLHGCRFSHVVRLASCFIGAPKEDSYSVFQLGHGFLRRAPSLQARSRRTCALIRAVLRATERRIAPGSVDPRFHWLPPAQRHAADAVHPGLVMATRSALRVVERATTQLRAENRLDPLKIWRYAVLEPARALRRPPFDRPIATQIAVVLLTVPLAFAVTIAFAAAPGLSHVRSDLQHACGLVALAALLAGCLLLPFQQEFVVVGAVLRPIVVTGLTSSAAATAVGDYYVPDPGALLCEAGTRPTDVAPVAVPATSDAAVSSSEFGRNNAPAVPDDVMFTAVGPFLSGPCHHPLAPLQQQQALQMQSQSDVHQRAVDASSGPSPSGHRWAAVPQHHRTGATTAADGGAAAVYIADDSLMFLTNRSARLTDTDADVMAASMDEAAVERALERQILWRRGALAVSRGGVNDRLTTISARGSHSLTLAEFHPPPRIAPTSTRRAVTSSSMRLASMGAGRAHSSSPLVPPASSQHARFGDQAASRRDDTTQQSTGHAPF